MPLLMCLQVLDGGCVPASRRTRSVSIGPSVEGGAVVTSAEPLHSRLNLPLSPLAVPEGRARVAKELEGWGVAEGVIDDARLIVSELLTNAVRHADEPHLGPDGVPMELQCAVFLWLTGRGLVVAVWDDSKHEPTPRRAGAAAENGRGLLLVEALSEQWGFHLLKPGPGKLVYARLSLPMQTGLEPHALAVGA